jgi:hypothetical protein
MTTVASTRRVRIKELARLTRSPARTGRYYQDSGMSGR